MYVRCHVPFYGWWLSWQRLHSLNDSLQTTLYCHIDTWFVTCSLWICHYELLYIYGINDVWILNLGSEWVGLIGRRKKIKKKKKKTRDESTARRQLKSPRSLSGRSIHLTLVTKWSPSWSWMTYCHILCAMSISPTISKFDHQNPWSRSCVWSKVKVTFELQHSNVKVIVKVKPIGHIWGMELSRYVCFSFLGNGTIFGWDVANFIFDLENSRSRSWPKWNPMVTFEP